MSAKKKILYIGLGVVAVGGAIKWYLSRQAANAANSDTAANNDAELAALMMQQPLAYASNSDSSASVSGPTVDTGSASLQSLINSILNPVTASTTGPGVSSGTAQAPIIASAGGSGDGSSTGGPGVSTGTVSELTTQTVSPQPSPIVSKPTLRQSDSAASVSTRILPVSSMIQ